MTRFPERVGDVAGTGFVYMDGKMTILDDPNFSYVVLNDINGSRQAVGFGYDATPDENQVALFWSE